MRNVEWEKSLYDHQHAMTKRLDKFRKRYKGNELTEDEIMAIEHSFQLLIASMLDLANYVLKHLYQVEHTSRSTSIDMLLKHNDVTYEQAEQMKFLIELREQILYDYLEENFSNLESAMDLRRYSLVEVLTKEWTTRLSNLA